MVLASLQLLETGSGEGKVRAAQGAGELGRDQRGHVVPLTFRAALTFPT